MENKRNNNIEDILNSLDGTQRAPAPNFFYTRLKAKMLARHEGGEKGIEVKSKRSWMLRPVYIVTGLLLVLALNTFAFLRNNNTETTSSGDNDVSAQTSIAAEYNLNEMTYVYDLNQDR